MPEAAVHEDHGTRPGEHQVRCARQLAIVKPVAKPQSMEPAPDDHLGLRIRGPNARHAQATLFRSERVGQRSVRSGTTIHGACCCVALQAAEGGTAASAIIASSAAPTASRDMPG